MQHLKWVGLALMAMVAGCGGGGALQVPGPRGEGNIPLGKVHDPDGGAVHVKVRDSGGRVQETVAAADGTVYVASLRPGPARIEFNSTRIGVEGNVIRLMAGVHQRHLFEAHLLTASQGENITESARIVGNFPNGALIREGEKRVLEFKLLNASASDARPTIYVSGGTASVRGEVMLGEVAGPGTLTVEYGPVSQTYRFWVVK